MMWIILGCIAAFIVVLYAFQALKRPSTQLGLKSNFIEPKTISGQVSSAVEELPGTVFSAAKEISHTVFGTHSSVATAQNSSALPTASSSPRGKEDDQRLHIFDEL